MKSLGKALIRDLALVVVLPIILVFRFQKWATGSGNSFAAWTQLLSLIPGKPGVYLRHAFLRCCSTGCDEDACVSFGTIFSHDTVRVGRSVYIGNFCSIGDAEICDDVLIASHVSIMNGCRQHGTDRLDIPVREQVGCYERVTIGEDSWIGERATVAASVGKHCVIGAGSVVVKPIPDYAIAVGVPAKVVGDRRENDRVKNQHNVPEVV